MTEVELTLPRFAHSCDTVLSKYVQTCVRGGMLKKKRWFWVRRALISKLLICGVSDWVVEGDKAI